MEEEVHESSAVCSARPQQESEITSQSLEESEAVDGNDDTPIPDDAQLRILVNRVVAESSDVLGLTNRILCDKIAKLLNIEAFPHDVRRKIKALGREIIAVCLNSSILLNMGE